MIALPARPTEPPETANDRLKASFDRLLWGSFIGATLLHFAVFALWPEMTAADISTPADAVETLELPPEVEIPEPPARLEKPALPVPTAEAPPEATISRTILEEHPPENRPPPPPAVTEGARQDPFVVYEVAPRILNRDEVSRAMERAYPEILRNAGIGGTVRVELHLDADGAVREARVVGSSGHAGLDRAALQVADVYRFSPALNRDQPVPVWISLPITFEVR